MQRVAGSRYGQFSGTDIGKSVTPAICYRIANLFNRDIGRWAVLLGRHPLENVSRGPKDWLRRDRTPPVRAKPKASLTGFPMIRDSEAKAGLSDPSCPHYWGLVVTEKLP